MKAKNLNLKTRAFTLIEVIVVISIIGMVTSISVISYGNWNKTLAVNMVKNDLTNIANALEGARTFGSAYPETLPVSFKASPDISVSGGGSADGKTYCVTAESSKNPGVKYYITSLKGVNDIKSGACGPMEISATTVSDTEISVTWSPVTGATGYTIQRDTNNSFPGPVSTTQAGTSLNSTGLNAITRYYYRVKATVGGQDSVWSKVVDARTNLYIPPPPEEPPVSDLTITPETEPYGVMMRLTGTIKAYTSCPAGTPQYSLRQSDGGPWSSYTAWSSSVRSIVTGWFDSEAPGTYYFEAISRCYVDAGNITNIVNTANSYSVSGGGSEMF